MIRRKKLVRVHFRDADSPDSVEGVLLGRTQGHYRLSAPQHLSEGGTRVIDGEVLIPRERVLYLQVIG